MIRRLFCYIEYNEIRQESKFNPDNYELIEIAVRLYADDEEVKSYSRFVRPQHFELMTKERYLSFGGLKEVDLQSADTIEDMSRRFYKTFYEYDLLITCVDEHENIWGKKRNFEKGYHMHIIYSKNLYDVLYYIHVHDRDLLKTKWVN